jgi:hypothetical protein
MSAAALAKLLDHVEHELGLHDARVITVVVPWDFDQVANRELLDSEIRKALGRDRIAGDLVILVETLAGLPESKLHPAALRSRRKPRDEATQDEGREEGLDGLY